MLDEVLISGCRILGGSDEIQDVWIRAGKVHRVGKSIDGFDGGEVIDAAGQCVCPGFIDLHLQGAGGADVIDTDADALERVSRTVARFGMTGWLATTIYNPGGNNDHLTAAREAVGRDLGGATVLGIHIEGPFVNRTRLGMLAPESVCDIDDYHLDRILDLCGSALKLMTIAPELPGALDVIEKLTARGVIPSFGHSDANYEQTQAGISAGISHVTHLFNAMRPIRHRDPGPIAALLAAKNVSIQLICDGVHIEKPVIWMVARIAGPDRFCLITDGGRLLGSTDSEFIHAGHRVYMQSGVLRSADGTLVGTGIGLSDLAGRFARFTGVPIAQAVRAGTITPRSVLGLANVADALVQQGDDADLVLAEIAGNRIDVKRTMVGGKTVYEAP